MPRYDRSSLPVLCLLGFPVVYLLAVCTPFGQRAENALMRGDGGAEPAWIYDWSGAAYGSSALPPLEHTAMPTLLVGLVVIAAVTVARRCWWRGVAAAGVVGAAVGGKEFARMLLPRPDLVGAPGVLGEGSFPSGHVAVPVGLVLGAVLVSAPRFRTHVTAAGMLWLAVTAGAVQATYHHRPSDVIGSTLLACACYGVAARALPRDEAPGTALPGGTRRSRASRTAAMALSAAGALVAGARDDGLAPSLVFAAAAFLCSVLVWCVGGVDGRAGAGPGRRGETRITRGAVTARRAAPSER
ncbi:phosphatase PAP2 family protein [Streptomyces sp. CA-181903]|uniref:phosphatase PAP2 family protein n=1 Tax=Streptomyces sp. CA-181903 TaxID=3240055 RepID=UPI003D8AE7EF